MTNDPEVCTICDMLVAPLYSGVCGLCWWKSVDSGIHTAEDLPAKLTGRT